ncbi:hypothetical protein IG631_22022 [Alternaria alternata]|nr:hypothetical protein IG631_22022 [Alternaria alternata]
MPERPFARQSNGSSPTESALRKLVSAPKDPRAYGRTPHQSMACLSDSGMYDACSLPYIASMDRIPRR